MFEFEHLILAKQARLETLVQRHNSLVASVPRELTEDTAPDMLMLSSEIEANMSAITALLVELENDCSRSEFMSKDAI
jgi:hypothetical protein